MLSEDTAAMLSVYIHAVCDGEKCAVTHMRCRNYWKLNECAAGYLDRCGPKQAVREAATICPRPCDLDLWLLILKVVLVTCDVGYLCANFSLPRPLCSRLRPDVRDRQIDRHTLDVRQHHRLMPRLGVGGTTMHKADNSASWMVVFGQNIII